MTPKQANLQVEIDSLKEQLGDMASGGHDLVSAQTIMESLLHHTSDAVIRFNADGLIESFNLAAQKIFGCPEMEVLFQTGSQMLQCPAWTAWKSWPG
ncbi:MAG: hypothetical protein O7D86_05215 [Proteobacteria bacterium]|nr:hypothetical protein [Pseudomonadota bacterium]